MYKYFSKIVFSAFLLAAGSINAATVDINGMTYQIATPDNLSFSAKLGESTTVSYAYDIANDIGGAVGGTFDTVFDNALAAGRTGFTQASQFIEALNVGTFSNSAFSLDVYRSLSFDDPLYQGPNYLRFDVTFAPTASTINADSVVFNSDPTAPPVFTADIYTEFRYDDYVILGPNDAATTALADDLVFNGFYPSTFIHNGYIVADDLSNTTLGPNFQLFGTVLPDTTSVAPVPVPGSMAMLGLGLLGLGALRKSKA